MNRTNFIKLIFTGMLSIFAVSQAAAQVENPIDEPVRSEAGNRRPNLLSELILTNEQISAIRRLNREKRPLLRLAQQRLREANRNLDQTVYVETVVDADIQTRLLEVQAAQAEVIKLRTSSELAVRRILTAAQLAKFRELRRRFSEDADARPNRRQNRRRDFPARKFLRGGRRPAN